MPAGALQLSAELRQQGRGGSLGPMVLGRRARHRPVRHRPDLAVRHSPVLDYSFFWCSDGGFAGFSTNTWPVVGATWVPSQSGIERLTFALPGTASSGTRTVSWKSVPTRRCLRTARE